MTFGLPQARVRVIARTSVLAVTAVAATFATLVPAQGDEVPATLQRGVSAPSEGEATAAPTAQSLAVPAAASAQKRTKIAGDDNVVAELSATGTKDFGMVGLTWSRSFSGDSVTAQIKTRSNGTWSAWKTLAVEDAQPGEGADARAGTEPLWVGEADGVAARVSTADGSRPTDLKVATVDGGAEPTDASLATAGATAAAPAVAPLGGDGAVDLATGPNGDAAAATTVAASQPRIVMRSAWKPKTSYQSTCSSPTTASATRAATLHHTAGNNSYTKAESPAIMRADHLYHTRIQKWCDIGYNFVVDKYGTIYEGRRGGITKQVRGAHSGKNATNTYSMGVSMMGNYDTAAVTSALRSSVASLIAWRFSAHKVPVTGKVSLDGRSLNRIHGHRDVKATACPGKYGYAWLTQSGSGGLRGMVAARMSSSTPPTAARLTGPIATEYARHRASLGSQMTGVRKTSTAGLQYAKFSNGKAYARGTKGYSIWGSIDRIHAALGGTVGKLGTPTRSVTRLKTGLYYATFSKGRVYSVNSTSYAGYGPVNSKYVALRGTKSRLGTPTTSIRESSRSQYQKYRHGNIKWVKKTGKYEITYS